MLCPEQRDDENERSVWKTLEKRYKQEQTRNEVRLVNVSSTCIERYDIVSCRQAVVLKNCGLTRQKH